MLSILIPVYNYNIVRLVNDLHLLAMETYVDFEIRVMEDGSASYLKENSSVANLKFCRYSALTHNIGRSAIRNRLADESIYEHLLFIDCDAEVNSTHFIEKYLSFCREEVVVVGGTAYDPENNDPEFSLRLKYGRMREACSALKREQNGRYSHFSSFNFLISKSIFNRIRFDESIRGYGHEDTLFGHRIAELNCEMHHIDNSLIHKGLDNNKLFIKKTEESTRNLFLLYKSNNYPFLVNQSKLLRTYIRLDQKKLTSILALLYDLLKSAMLKKLCGADPSLKIYDLYKLLFLAKISHFH